MELKINLVKINPVCRHKTAFEQNCTIFSPKKPEVEKNPSPSLCFPFHAQLQAQKCQVRPLCRHVEEAHCYVPQHDCSKQQIWTFFPIWSTMSSSECLCEVEMGSWAYICSTCSQLEVWSKQTLSCPLVRRRRQTCAISRMECRAHTFGSLCTFFLDWSCLIHL